MYSKLPNVIYGFHGCHKDVFEKVIKQGEHLDQSRNKYDWLGHGVYFWENNVERAEEWAREHFGDDGRVVGAVLDLGHCLNLADKTNIQPLKEGFELLQMNCNLLGQNLPKNRYRNESGDTLLRDLDCAIIEATHQLNEKINEPPFDSVRGVFFEGPPIAEGSEIREQTHIQIAICNPNCIKGYFIPRDLDDSYPNP